MELAQEEDEATRELKLDVLRTAAWQDPTLAIRLADDLPRTPEGDSQAHELARCLLNGGNALFRFDQLYQQAPQRLQQQLLEAAFDRCLNSSSLDDPQKWIARLSLLPDSSRPKGTESLARAWAQQTPEEAIAWAASLPLGDTQNGAMAAIASGWAAKDARGAADWVASLPPGAERDRSAESLVAAVAPSFPHEAWDWAMNISDSTLRIRAATEAAKAMAARDPAIARQWIEASPFTQQAKGDLQSAVDKARPAH